MPLVLSPQGHAKPISVGPIDPLRSEAPELWRGASALISIGDQGAPVNVVSRARLITAGSPLRVATPWGMAHRHGTGTGQGAVIPGYSAVDGDAAGALLIVFRLRPFGTSKDPIVCIQQGTSTAHLCYLRREADGQLRMFLRGGGIDYWGWTSTGWTTGELYAALVTGGPAGNTLWRNGRQVTPTYSSGSSASTQWLSSLPLADTWRLAAFYSPSQLVGDVELLHYAHWSRALTTAEAEAVTSDPWAMLRSRRTLVALASGAPAAPVSLGVPFDAPDGLDFVPGIVPGTPPAAVGVPYAAPEGVDHAPAVAVAPGAIGIPFAPADGADLAPGVQAGVAAGTLAVPFSAEVGADYTPGIVPGSLVLLVPFSAAAGADHPPTLVQVVHGYLTGRVQIAPALSGVVAVRAALSGALTLTPADR